MSNETTVTSINLADMTLDELVMLSQGLGHQAEKIREQRRYLKVKIAERLAAGERNGAGAAPGEGAGTDGSAPGAVLEASAVH